MAARFSADGQDYVGSVSISGITGRTLACWAKISTNRSTYSTFLSVDDGGTTHYAAIAGGSNGTTLGYFENLNSVDGPVTLSVGTWYYVAAVVTAAGALTIYSRALGASSWTTQSGSGFLTSTNWTRVQIGESVWTGEWLNGCVTGAKIYTAALTADELENEMFQHLPARTTSLIGWWPLIRPENTDYSGNGVTLTGGSGVTEEDGPPIMWADTVSDLWVPDVPSDTPPSVPTGLTSTDIRANEVDLTWNASTDDVGVTGYEISIAPV